MKRIILAIALLASTMGLRAQVNIQELYDFNRDHLTTTLEMFKADKWGSTFFFTDIYHPWDKVAPTDFYTEISRNLNFWKDSKLGALSLHVEWNGGLGENYLVNNAWLFGADYLLHNGDFSNTISLTLMYKRISGQTDNCPIQFTCAWGMRDLFNVKGLEFSGFLDIWGEVTEWNIEDDSPSGYHNETTSWVILSEPQLWYNIGQHFGCEHLSIGGEVELAYNFSGGYKAPAFLGPTATFSNQNKGFTAAPCIGLKWIF